MSQTGDRRLPLAGRLSRPGSTIVRRDIAPRVAPPPDAVERIARLDRREVRTLRLLGQGLTAEEAASREGCTTSAIRKRLLRIYDALELPRGRVMRATYLLGRYDERHGVDG